MEPPLSQAPSPPDCWPRNKRFIFLFAMAGLFLPLISLTLGFNLSNPLFIIVCPGALALFLVFILPVHGHWLDAMLVVVVLVSNTVIYALIGALSWKFFAKRKKSEPNK
jgi:hypothetical protein